MKILIVTNMYPTKEKPELGIFIKNQTESLKKLGNEVEIYFFNKKNRKINYIIACFVVFLKTIINSYDVVHAHYGTSGIPAIFRWKTPLVVTYHGSDLLYGKIEPFLSKLVYKFADVNIVVANHMDINKSARIISCGINLNKFRPMSMEKTRKKLKLPLDKYIILFPYDPQKRIKRYDLVEEVKEELIKQGFNVEILSAQNINNDKMPLLYNAANFMILCSDSEGSPTSIKESIACQTPIISTDVGDIKELYDGYSFCKICDKSVKSLSEGIIYFIEKEKCKIHFNSEILKKIDENYIAGQINEIYYKLLENN